MQILIKNCNLISMDENREKIEYGVDILINEDKIEQIDKNLNISNIKIIDATNKYVLPGLINTHSHIGMSIFRESVDGYQTQDWLTQKIWPIEDKLTKDDIYKSSLLSCIEMIKTGTTTVNDQYFFPKDIIKAVVESGIRAELTRVVMDIDNNLNGRFNELESLINNYNGKYNNVYINVGIHGLYTTSQIGVTKAIELAKKHNLNIHMHYLENSQESTDISNNYKGKKPYEIVNDNFENTNSIFAHCVKLSDEDYSIFRKYNIKVAHCPISNLKLGCGIANVPKMLKNGITVSLGTDGQGSGSNLDMFETMKFTGLLQKGINENPILLPAYEILKMATINGAKALNKDNLIGSIAIGKLADLIILDLSNVTAQPINDIFADIVYNAKGENVETTIVGGNVLMEDRKLTNLDENEIIENCKNILDKYIEKA
ncbi:MAG: amidohydrolase [Clostridia bacterium]|nr:amidohydrolase [Clostridia bacterium]